MKQKVVFTCEAINQRLRTSHQTRSENTPNSGLRLDKASQEMATEISIPISVKPYFQNSSICLWFNIYSTKLCANGTQNEINSEVWALFDHNNTCNANLSLSFSHWCSLSLTFNMPSAYRVALELQSRHNLWPKSAPKSDIHLVMTIIFFWKCCCGDVMTQIENYY